MSDTASTPVDPFQAPTAAPAAAPVAVEAPAPAETTVTNPFDPPAEVAPVAAASSVPTGPTFTPGTVVAYVHDDPYTGKTIPKAGIVVSFVDATDEQGPQVVVAWLQDDLSVLPTGSLMAVGSAGS